MFDNGTIQYIRLPIILPILYHFRDIVTLLGSLTLRTMHDLYISAAKATKLKYKGSS